MKGLYFGEITAAKIASSLQILPGSTAGTFHASVAEAPGGFQDFVTGCEVDGVRVGCSELPDVTVVRMFWVFGSLFLRRHCVYNVLLTLKSGVNWG